MMFGIVLGIRWVARFLFVFLLLITTIIYLVDPAILRWLWDTWQMPVNPVLVGLFALTGLSWFWPGGK